MKTRNGLSSLISESLDDFALRTCVSAQIHRPEIRTSGGIWIKGRLGLRHWQLLSGSLVPDRAL